MGVEGGLGMMEEEGVGGRDVEVMGVGEGVVEVEGKVMGWRED